MREGTSKVKIVFNNNSGFDPAYNIILQSQAAYATFSFRDDGKVKVYNEDEEKVGVNTFNSYSDFVDWYRRKEFTWTSDLGSNLVDYDEDEDVEI